MTLFSPFERIHESYGKGLDVERFFMALMANILMRIVGALVRAIVIVVGIVVLVSALIGGLFFFVLWIFLPLIAIMSVIYGIALFLIPL